jgi:glycosidase
MAVPDWVQDAIFYQIFPDRFANGDPKNDPPNLQVWGSPPNRWDYQGGDLRGIINKLDYFHDLGVNGLYLNPIFHSTANHRYHIIDYLKIDPFLGDLSDFQELISRAHGMGIRIILDAVLNHTGRGFFAFSNLIENGEHSPYRDWYHIKRFPLKAFSPGKAINYTGWWDIKDLPKLNTANPDVRNYLFDITRYWMEQGIDGWRLDVPNEIDDDDFWAQYRVLVKGINPEAYLVGEIWDVDPRWVDDDHFDGLMNYPLREAITDSLMGKSKHSSIANVLLSTLKHYGPENNLAMYNALGSHDTKRLMTKLRGNMAKTRLAYATLFSLPGAPAIYYGDEVGMRGGREPASRSAFPWEQSAWNQDLRDWLKTLIRLRKEYAPLRRGEIKMLVSSSPEDALLFKRSYQGEQLIIALNFANEKRAISTMRSGESLTGRYKDILNNEILSRVHNKLELTLPAFGSAWLTEI